MSWEHGHGSSLARVSNGIMRVSANGGKPERLVSVKGDELAHGPQMLPGGQAGAVYAGDRHRRRFGGNKAHVVVADAGSLANGRR